MRQQAPYRLIQPIFEEPAAPRGQRPSRWRAGHPRRSRSARPRLTLTSRLRLSLSNRLALMFLGVTLLAVGALYVYVAPGLQSRLMDQKLAALAYAARTHTGALRRALGGPAPARELRRLADLTASASGDRVTVLAVNRALGMPQLSVALDSEGPQPGPPIGLGVARRALSRATLSVGAQQSRAGETAQAAVPVADHGSIDWVIVLSAPLADVMRTVGTVRREVLVAGLIALAIALVAGYFVARALARRVTRLEAAVRQVAEGDFSRRIGVDSGDELGRLAVAFNEMAHQLQQMDQARKKFIATASHELRTPVFSLGGFVELLEDEELDSDTRRRFLEQVRQQVQRLHKLSVDLLDLSRLESGSLELRPEEVDLGELTRSVSGEFEPALAAHDSRLELRLPGGRAILAQCDPVRIAQILRILIDNALTHTPRGTHIVVSAQRRNGLLTLAVRDDGEGIDPALQRRIFEPFYTANDAQGSGLGLAIASELAERMSGRLTVTSDAGATTFTLEIPA
ncbi:MAG TPA: HAMP domain-containing sensor histidine kinase [Solirubrobacteraceae bacterium]|nr:HAMP domain-containing sensor histidine kinase [Solirubrobacteraceae bacterium]